MNDRKLSFSLRTNPNSKPRPKPSQFANESTPNSNSKPNHEYITEFDSSKTLIDKKKKTVVIPPKENEWRAYKKMKSLDLPPFHPTNGRQQLLQFEVEDSNIAPPGADAGNQMSYGLNMRQSTSGKADSAIMLKKLKGDLDGLLEEEGFEQFDEVPVEGFGAALLAGYGWREGRGIGRNAKEDVKVIEYKRRAAKEGLGF